MTPMQLKAELDVLAYRLEHGCGNNGCVIKKPRGMATNGPCLCRARMMSAVLLSLAADLEVQRVWPTDTEVQPKSKEEQ